MNARLLPILLLAAAGAVHAQASAPATPAAGAATEPASATATTAAKPEKVCTREKPMGSNRTVRVCRDAAGAAARAESDREALERAQRERFSPLEG